MSNLTTNMHLSKAVDSDNAETYLASTLPASLDIVDGHRHGGGTDGLGVKAVIADLAANRPAAGTKGRVFYATDTDTFSVDRGAAWHTLADVDSTQTLTGKTLTASGPIQGHQGANIGSSGNQPIGTDGNVFGITGSNTINLLDTLGWQNGGEVVLYFPSGLTVKNNQVASSTFKPLLLASGVDFVAAANATLTLRLINSVWVETARRP